MLRCHGKLWVLLGVVALLMFPATLSWAGATMSSPVDGGHATVLNAIYPEVWDPHIAGTIGPLAAVSPLYNQVVEYNPLNPSEIIGDLAKRWEVTDGGLTYTFGATVRAKEVIHEHTSRQRW